MRERKSKILVGDFETTVYNGQERTDVWASALVEIWTEDVKIFGSIAETHKYLLEIPGNIVIYYHNLKFDGPFWLDYLLLRAGYKQASTQEPDNINTHQWIKLDDAPAKSITYSISDLGAWYRIIIKVNRSKIIEIRDSMKLLPMSVKALGDSFGTLHKKLEMEYKGVRYPGCEITQEERAYIANDVLVVKEALEYTFTEGHKKLTIGSCCLSEYHKLIGKPFEKMFPNLYEMPIDGCFGAKTAGEYIHKSYRGGWCYLVKGKENRIFRGGTTADVNSLYPSMMSSDSGNKYPIGYPKFWRGDFIPPEAQAPYKYYFVRIKTRFYLKPGFLPFIQLKNTLLYRGTEMLESSDIINPKTGEKCGFYTDSEKNVQKATVEMVMTMTDFARLLRHYDLIDFEILDGCYFDARAGIFDEYIYKYRKMKTESTGGKRQIAKLYLNNLYGKMAASTASNYKVAYNNDGKISFYTVVANDKKPGYIPVGSAITSYAREFTIRAAQENFHGADKPGFIYADTDSIHCDLSPDNIKGIQVHDKNFCAWKLESCWDEAMFVRQKTYWEHITHENLQAVESPYYDIKCAGMPQHCKDLFLAACGEKQVAPESEEEAEFLQKHLSMQDFSIGLSIPGKLVPRRIPGGVLLTETTYKMR